MIFIDTVIFTDRHILKIMIEEIDTLKLHIESYPTHTLEKEIVVEMTREHTTLPTTRREVSHALKH